MSTSAGPRDAPPQPTAPTPRDESARPARRPVLVGGRGLRRGVLAGCAVLVTMILVNAYSVGQALTAPGTDSVAARLAEWGRDHRLSPVVTALEGVAYSLSPPKVGGEPPASALRQLRPAGPATTSPQGAGEASLPPDTVAIRPSLQPFVADPLPGEGVWKPLATVRGLPAVQATYLRPDSSHTSYLAGVVWMDAAHTRFVSHPGFAEPGHGPWSEPDWIPPGARAGLLATWNGAFKMADAHGGFYLGGKTVGELAGGAASEVFYRDGHMTVGAWGRDATLTPDVVSVRQNLRLLVDDGRVAPDVDTDIENGWGLTMGGAHYVWRSGVGVTAAGDLVYAAGPALSVRTLAQLLQRAGAERAMELDINPAWVSFMSYRPGSTPEDPTPVKLLDFQRPADRYLTETSRDFVAVYAR